MTERKDPLAHMIPTDGLRDVDILILDAFAVAGGSASQDQAFELIERKLWGHMAGTDKRQTFDDAIERLVQQGALVPWGTERAPTLALPPRPYELPPRRPGGKPYIPGTEYWASERDTHLSEAHRQLAVHRQEVDALRAKFMQEFEPERTRLLQVVKRQIDRRQMDTSARNDMLVALSKLLLSPTEIAVALELSETEIDAALNPKTATPRRSRKLTVVGSDPPAPDIASLASEHASLAIEPEGPAIANAKFADEDARLIERLAKLARDKGGSVTRQLVTQRLHITGVKAGSIIQLYGERYPGCIEYVESNMHGGQHGGYKTVIHAPPEEASA